MPMNYDPEAMTENEGGGQRATPGTYRFFVNDASETTFRSGNEGVKVQLDVAAFHDKDVKVYDQFVYVSQSLWKLEQFLTCLGLDFNSPPSVDQLIGKQGQATFIMGESRNDGRQYLEPDEYIPPGATPPRQSTGPGNMAAQGAQRAQRPNDNTNEADDDDSVPF